MLDFYYNVKYKDDFDLLKDCYIYKNPTPLKNGFHIMKFDFSAVSTQGDVNENFSRYCNSNIQKFLDTYNFNFKINQDKPAHTNMRDVFAYLQQNHKDIKIYILIDEYDNLVDGLFTNNKSLDENIVSSIENIYEDFFKLLNSFTTDNDSLLKKMFFTGVNSLALFNIVKGIDITNEYIANDMIGITENELEDMIKYYELDEIYNDKKDIIKKWYGNYKFNENINHTIYNKAMILYYVNELKISGKEPNKLIDINVRINYKKLKHFVYTNNQLNSNFDILKTLFVQNYINVCTIRDSLFISKLTKSKNFISSLRYLGLVTIDKQEMGDIRLVIPNHTIRTIMAKFVNTMLNDTNTLNLNIQQFSNGIYDLAFDDSLKLFHYLANELDNATSLQDLVSQESDIKMFFMTYFSLNRLYATFSEIELNKGYADIFLLKAPNIEDDIPNILIEFKFLKQSDTSFDLDNIVQGAKEQIIQYKSTSKFSVNRSIIVVFQGFKLLYCEFEK
jgi:hypothetical protein